MVAHKTTYFESYFGSILKRSKYLFKYVCMSVTKIRIYFVIKFVLIFAKFNHVST